MGVAIQRGLSKTSSIVYYLVSKLPFGGFRIWVDNLYVTPQLAKRLFLDFGAYISGTWRANFGVPSILKNSRVNKGECNYVLHRENRSLFHLLGMKLSDNKVFYFLTSWLEPIVWTIGGVKETLRLQIIHHYNKYMNAVDRFDQRSENLNVYQKSVKWWKVVWSWCLNVTLHNSHVIYNAFHPISRLRFHLQLIDEIVAKHYKGPRNSNRTPGERYSEHIPRRNRCDGTGHWPDRREQRRCVVCYGEGRRREPTSYCTKCNVNLCLGYCYKEWHKNVTL
jgi:hypothetical protein